MLYATTRDHKNIYTARHPLCKDADSDGGLFIPFQNVVFTGEQISGLKEKSFGQCAAEVLNIFFGAKLCGRDVDLVLGRHPFQFAPMSHKILISEVWANPGNDFFWTVKQLRELVLPNQEELSNWMKIVGRIATLFGVYAELAKLGVAGLSRPLDIAVSAEDFSTPISVLYAKQMGLPIGRIIFGCTEGSGVWNLFNHGEFRGSETDFPGDLERLIYERLGREEVKRFADCVNHKRLYTLPEEKRAAVSRDFFGAVISDFRRDSVASNVFSTNSYQMDTSCAVAYGALQDYRTIHGETGPVLIWSEHSIKE